VRLSRSQWIAAAALAALAHAAIFVGLRAPTPGEPPGGTGPQVQVLGSSAQVFGTDERQPEDPAPAITAEAAEEIAAEPPGARAEQAGPDREAREDAPRKAEADEAEPVKDETPVEVAEMQATEAVSAEPAQPFAAEPASEAVLEAADDIEAESENIVTPVRRPTPTEAERKPVNRPQRTARTPSRQRGQPRRQTSGRGEGQRRSGARAASERTGSGRPRASASPGQARSYAAAVRARIARNRPSSRGRRGTAVVRFAISRGGGLRYARLARSSGDGALDRAALASVRRAAPFPRPPRGMSAGQLTFSIPFRFR